MAAQPTYQRPVGVTLLEIYGFVVGAANILGGILLIINRNDGRLLTESFNNSGALVTAGVLAVLFGALQIVLAYFLGHASNFVRMVYAVVATFNLAIGIWAAVALHSTQRASGIVTSLFAGLVLYLLFNHRADEYFGHPYKHDQK